MTQNTNLVDHFEEAERLLSTLDHVDDDHRAFAATVAEAQVHATLAVAAIGTRFAGTLDPSGIRLRVGVSS